MSKTFITSFSLFIKNFILQRHTLSQNSFLFLSLKCRFQSHISSCNFCRRNILSFISWNSFLISLHLHFRLNLVFVKIFLRNFSYFGMTHESFMTIIEKLGHFRIRIFSKEFHSYFTDLSAFMKVQKRYMKLPFKLKNIG